MPYAYTEYYNPTSAPGIVIERTDCGDYIVYFIGGHDCQGWDRNAFDVVE